MSESIAALRRGVGHDLHDLAEQHFKHELAIPPGRVSHLDCGGGSLIPYILLHSIRADLTTHFKVSSRKTETS
jgi:hypothetical protein